jgi:Tfp pilus assembly protein PilF
VPGVTGEQIQQAHLLPAISYYQKKDLQKCLDCLKKAVAAAPNSKPSSDIKQFIAQVQGQLKATKGDKK